MKEIKHPIDYEKKISTITSSFLKIKAIFNNNKNVFDIRKKSKNILLEKSNEKDSKYLYYQSFLKNYSHKKNDKINSFQETFNLYRDSEKSKQINLTNLCTFENKINSKESLLNKELKFKNILKFIPTYTGIIIDKKITLNNHKVDKQLVMPLANYNKKIQGLIKLQLPELKHNKNQKSYNLNINDKKVQIKEKIVEKEKNSKDRINLKTSDNYSKINKEKENNDKDNNYFKTLDKYKKKKSFRNFSIENQRYYHEKESDEEDRDLDYYVKNQKKKSNNYFL